jgi:hypothetical protein
MKSIYIYMEAGTSTQVVEDEFKAYDATMIP